MKKTINLLVLLFIFFGCKNEISKKSADNISNKPLNYDELIYKIVKSSNLDTKLYDKYYTMTDRIENDSIIIKAYIENNVSDNPNEKQIVESAIAWLLLLPEKEKLFNISSDPENPLELSFDKQLCEKIIKSNIYIESHNKNQKLNNNNIMENNESDFDNVFIEKSTIKFKPNDLNNLEDKVIQDFKKRLYSYIEQNPKKEDFDVDNLLGLINNQTFSNSEGFIDSSWVDYFIKKYKIENIELGKLLDLIIEREDLDALKVLLNNGYLFSYKELKQAQEKNKSVEKIIKKNDVEDYYDKYYSKIKEIELLINEKYLLNHIQDSDGYTNLRKDKSKESEITEKLLTGDKIQVLDNTNNWFLVKTKSGKEGYVFRTKIKSD